MLAVQTKKDVMPLTSKRLPGKAGVKRRPQTLARQLSFCPKSLQLKRMGLPGRLHPAPLPR